MADGALIITIVIACLIAGAVAFLIHNNAVRDQQDDAFLACVNAEIFSHNDNITYRNSDECFQFALKKCGYIYNRSWS